MMRTIDVRELLEHPGSQRSVHVSEPVPSLKLELVEVPEDAPIEGDLLLQSVVEGILVSGRLAGRWALRCARCLTDFEHDFALDVADELFTSEAEDDGEEYPMDPSVGLDPEPMVRDSVLLAMPFAPLCRPDCRGLCERCGGNRNLDACTCVEPIDPRWSGLDVFFDIDDRT